LKKRLSHKEGPQKECRFSIENQKSAFFVIMLPEKLLFTFLYRNFWQNETASFHLRFLNSLYELALFDFFNENGAVGANRLTGFTGDAIFFAMARFHSGSAINAQSFRPADGMFGTFLHAEAAAFA